MVWLWSVRLDGVRTDHDYWLRDFAVERGRVEYREIRKDAPRYSRKNARCELRWHRCRPVDLAQSKRDFDEADKSGTRSEALKLMSVRHYFALEIAQCSDPYLRYAMLRSGFERRGDG